MPGSPQEAAVFLSRSGKVALPLVNNLLMNYAIDNDGYGNREMSVVNVSTTGLFELHQLQEAPSSPESIVLTNGTWS